MVLLFTVSVQWIVNIFESSINFSYSFLFKDIKPVVPWDVPGYFNGEKLVVPEWVSADDEMSSVVFSKQAESDLAYLSKRKKFAPWYNEIDSYDAAEAIKEVVKCHTFETTDPTQFMSIGGNESCVGWLKQIQQGAIDDK